MISYSSYQYHADFIDMIRLHNASLNGLGIFSRATFLQVMRLTAVRSTQDPGHGGHDPIGKTGDKGTFLHQIRVAETPVDVLFLFFF